MHVCGEAETSLVFLDLLCLPLSFCVRNRTCQPVCQPVRNPFSKGNMGSPQSKHIWWLHGGLVAWWYWRAISPLQDSEGCVCAGFSPRSLFVEDAAYALYSAEMS